MSFLELITDDQLFWGSISWLVHLKVCRYWGGCVQSQCFVTNTYRNFLLNVWLQKCCICLHSNVTTHYQAKWTVKCVWRPAFTYRALMIIFSELECMRCSKIPVFWNIMLCILVCRYPCLEEHISDIFSAAQVTLLGLPWKCWPYAAPTVVPYIPFYVVTYTGRQECTSALL